jgi:hypothetical protein
MSEREYHHLMKWGVPLHKTWKILFDERVWLGSNQGKVKTKLKFGVKRLWGPI